MMSGGIISNFTFTVDTSLGAGIEDNDLFIFPAISTGSYNCIVAWGDGTSSTITTYNDPQWEHIYPEPGVYTIVISGKVNGLLFNATGNFLKIIEISRWGSFKPVTGTGVFRGCSNLEITATDILDLSLTTSMTQFFFGCASLTTIPSLNQWNFRNVTSIGNFLGGSCVLFNMPINIQAPLATSIGSFLDGATSFNSPVTINAPLSNSYASMFRNTAMNSAINLNSTVMLRCDGMFQNTPFNQPLTNFGTTTLCTRFDLMFSGAASFDQDVSFLSISALVNAANMMTGSAFSITNYNKLLDITTGWPSQATVQNGVTFSAGSAHYSGANAIAGRDALIQKFWFITDAGTP